LGALAEKAITDYAQAVRDRAFPGEAEVYQLKK